VLALGLNVAWSGTVSYAEESDDETNETFQDSQGLTYSPTSATSVKVYVPSENADKVSGGIVIPATIKNEESGVSYKVEGADNLFEECTKITSAVLPSTWNAVPVHAFDHCTGLKSVTLKANKVKVIDFLSFSGCSKLKEIKNIEKVQEIGVAAFSSCISLKKLNLSGVIAICYQAFDGCKNLTSITIGKKLSWIDKYAFASCKKLKTIVIKSTKVKKVSKEAFFKTSQKITIKVPKKKLKAYTKLFKNKGNKKVVVKAI
jgi:hypothetical protein